MHLMRSPPGDPSSLELCIDAALGPVEDFADTATMVADKLNALDPNISIYSMSPEIPILLCGANYLDSLCRRVDAFANHRCSSHQAQIYSYHSLLTGDKRLAWPLRAAYDGLKPRWLHGYLH